MAKKKYKLPSQKKSPLMWVVVLLVGIAGLATLLLTSADTTDYQPPNGLTTNSRVDGSNYYFAFSWTPGARNPGAKYTANAWIVVWKLNGTILNHVYITPYSVHSYQINNLSCGTTYNIEVRADRTDSSSPTGFAGESPYSSIDSTTQACPVQASVSITGFSISGTTATVNWTATGSPSQFDVYLSPTNGGNTIVNTTSGASRSWTGTVSCGTSYNASVIERVSGGSATSPSKGPVAAAACAPTGGGGGGTGGGGTGGGGTGGGGTGGGGTGGGGTGGGSTGGGSTGGGGTGGGSSGGSSGGGSSGGSSSGGSSGGTKKTPSSTPSKPQPPAAPTNFAAKVQSDKVVVLSWNASVASAGIANYVLDRSLDNQNWTNLTTTSDTNYQDADTNFSTAYYYRVEAIDNNGNVSPYATTSAKTKSFSGGSKGGQTISSDDKLVKAKFPDGATKQSVDCTISSSGSSSIGSSGSGVTLLLGPYGILCVDADGNIVDHLDKPVQISINLSQFKNYTNFSIKTGTGDSLKTTQSTYNPQTRIISFQTKNLDASFEVYGKAHKSAGGPIVSIVLTLVLLALLAAGFMFLRRRLGYGGPALPSGNAADMLPMAPSAQEQFEAAVNRPNCTHLSMAHQVTPQTEGCQECMATGQQWVSLRICLTCGHVGCSDDSVNQHARKHYEETGHPLMMAFNDPNARNIGWCYIDQTYV